MTAQVYATFYTTPHHWHFDGTQFKGFRRLPKRNSRTLKVLGSFRGFSRALKTKQNNSRTFNDPQEPLLRHTNQRSCKVAVPNRSCTERRYGSGHRRSRAVITNSNIVKSVQCRMPAATPARSPPSLRWRRSASRRAARSCGTEAGQACWSMCDCEEATNRCRPSRCRTAAGRCCLFTFGGQTQLQIVWLWQLPKHAKHTMSE